jgi:hypothetical protein
MLSRWGLLLLVLGGILAFSPALRSPFLLDDYLHVAMVEGTFPAHRGPLDLYDFVSDADRDLLFSRGILPWWSHPRLTIRFFRPLSSALLWANHRVFGSNVIALHAMSLLWWVGAVLAARALFNRLFSSRESSRVSSRVAWMATVIFALAPCHAIPLAWLANFEVLVSLTLGTIGLAAYVRWREDRSKGAALLATIAFGAALLGGEYALCFGGYLLAFEVVRRGDPIVRRIVGLVPFVLPVVAYLAVRFVRHYGTDGSGFYTDPLHDPVGYLRAAPWRFVALLADGWGTADADTWGPDSPRGVMVALVAIGALALVVPIRRTLAALDDDKRRAAKWLMLGSIVSMAPVLSVAPSPRVLGIPAIGIAAVVALVVDHAWFPTASRDPALARNGAAELTGFVALLLAFAHFVHGPVTSFLLSRQMRGTAVEFRDHVRWLRTHIGDERDADVVIVRGLGGMFFAPFAIEPDARPPEKWRILAQTGHVLVLRPDARTLVLVAQQDRTLTSVGPTNLFRPQSDPLHAGDEIDFHGIHITVLDANAEGPKRAKYVFDRDLEDLNGEWIAEGVNGFSAVELPKIGFGAPLEP